MNRNLGRLGAVMMAVAQAACVHITNPKNGNVRQDVLDGMSAEERTEKLEYRKKTRFENTMPLSGSCIAKSMYAEKGSWTWLCMIPTIPLDALFGWRFVTREAYYFKQAKK